MYVSLKILGTKSQLINKPKERKTNATMKTTKRSGENVASPLIILKKFYAPQSSGCHLEKELD